MIIAFPPSPSWSQVWTKTKKSLASHKIASLLPFKIQTQVPAKTSVNWELEAGNWRIENTKVVCCDLLCVCAHYCIHYIDKAILFRILDIAGLRTVIFSFSLFFLTILLCYFIHDIPGNYYNVIRIVCHLSKLRPLQ